MSNILEFPNKNKNNGSSSKPEKISKGKTPRRYPISTNILSDMLTERARKIGAIEQNESFVIESTEGDEVVTEMKGYVE